MSERFVEAFLIAPSRLSSLLGTPEVGFAAISRLIGKKPIFDDLVMTFGNGKRDVGLAKVTAGLDQLAAGAAPTVAYPERLIQLVLHAHAAPLEPAMMECNYMPADEDGLWRPAFRALEMPTIAGQWGTPSLALPAGAKAWGWPILSLIEPESLARWQAELAAPWRVRLAGLPSSTFDPEADDAAADDAVYLSRPEVERGVGALATWVEQACTRRAATDPPALVLLLDGDQ